MKPRSLLAAGIVAASVAAGAGAGALLFTPGVSSAQQQLKAVAADVTGPGGPNGRGRFAPGAELSVAAKAIGISDTDLVTELRAGKSIADVAKAHNVDPQIVIDAIVADAKSRITDLVNGKVPLKLGGPGRFGGAAAELSVVATTIGISESDLRTELQGGKSIADVAKAHNVDVQKVIDAVVNDESKKIDDAVTAGKLTSDQATKLKAALNDRVTALVNGQGPRLGGPGGGGRRGGRVGPPGGGGAGGTTSPAAQSA